LRPITLTGIGEVKSSEINIQIQEGFKFFIIESNILEIQTGCGKRSRDFQRKKKVSISVFNIKRLYRWPGFD